MKGRGQGLYKGWSRQGQKDSGAEPTTIAPLVRAHPPWLLDEAVSAASKMAKDAEEATSESPLTVLAKGKEKSWWSIDLEGEMEKLEVVGLWSGTEGGSLDPKGKMGHRSARVKAARGK